MCFSIGCMVKTIATQLIHEDAFIVVTNHENTQASESTYRDADMAKEMVNFTKASILAQSSQSMLIHSNQDLGHVMGLLE